MYLNGLNIFHSCIQQSACLTSQSDLYGVVSIVWKLLVLENFLCGFEVEKPISAAS